MGRSSYSLPNEPSDDSYRAVELVAGFAALNPHATFTLDGRTYRATLTDWPKWSPTAPTSAYWYSEDTLRDLIAAYLTRDRGNGRERTVREFVAEFRGLSSTAKRKEVTQGWSGRRLQDFVADGDVDPDFVRELLTRMQAASSPPPAKALGVIGKEHLTAWMVAQGVSPESIRYARKAGNGGSPFVLEVAFGINEDDDSTRRILTGLNWSPVIGGDPELELRAAISEARLDRADPITLVVHIARPRFAFADRGKTRLTVSSGDIAKAIESAMRYATKAWKREKRRADREDRVSHERIERLRYRPPKVTIREVAFEVMEASYLKASGNGKHLTNARQIMYAARPTILEAIDAAKFDDQYFTQTLLKDYLEEYRPYWRSRVVWDARGHFVEPHTGRRIGLGGAEVIRYIEQWGSVIDRREKPSIKVHVDTAGPENRFSNALFIEKEGFSEILTAAGIEKRYDVTILSSKGVPITAACEVIVAMHRKGVRTFVLRDFDFSGFKIVRTLRNGVRLSSGSPVVDLGLRLNDVEGLPAEPDEHRSKVDPRIYLQDECDATDEEAAFLVSGGYPGRWRGHRVEINAMTSDQLIAWLEAKFDEHGVQKVIPESDTLNNAYRRAVFLKRMQVEIAELEAEMQDDDTAVPVHLPARVKALLKKNPAMSWDEAVWELAEDDS